MEKPPSRLAGWSMGCPDSIGTGLGRSAPVAFPGGSYDAEHHLAWPGPLRSQPGNLKVTQW